MEKRKEGDNQEERQKPTSKRVTDHLANERTFLAWMRTGLATITFGFMVARFGLFLRELNKDTRHFPETPVHFSSIIGISLAALGVVTILLAFLNFLYVRRSIETEQFYPGISIVCLLTILASVIGFLLVLYLFFTS